MPVLPNQRQGVGPGSGGAVVTLAMRQEASNTLSSVGASATSSSGGGVSASDLLSEAASHWDVSGTSVVMAWLFAIGAMTAAIVFYSTRRLKYKAFYMPRFMSCHDTREQMSKQNQLRDGVFIPSVPEVEQGFLAWLKPSVREFVLEINICRRKNSIRDRDVELMHRIGLDAISFILFARLLRWLFTILAILVGLPLSMANYYINTESSYGSSNGTSILSDPQVLTAADISGNALWVHIGFEWIATSIVCILVYTNIQHHVELIKAWADHNFDEVSFKSVMVTKMPASWFDHVVSEKDHESVVRAKIGGGGGGGGASSGSSGGGDIKVVLIEKQLGFIHEKLTEYEDQLHETVQKLMRHAKHDGKVVQYAGLWHRIIGKRQDTAELLLETHEKLEEIKTTQKEARARKADQIPSTAFVTFRSAATAHDKLKALLKRKKLKSEGVRLGRAPRSSNIIWKNLEKAPLSILIHESVGMVAICLVGLFYTIPLMAIMVLANLETLISAIPSLNNDIQSSQILSAIISASTGVVPAAISSGFSYLLPMVMRRLNKWSGALTRGQLDKNVIRQLFILLLVTNFVCFSLMGVLYDAYLSVSSSDTSTLLAMLKSVQKVPSQISDAYISQSTYWLSYFPVRSMAVWFELLQIPRYCMQVLKKAQLSTGKDVAKMAQPRTFEYAIEYGHMLFAMVVGLVLLPVAPLVTVCSTMYFWTTSIVYTNNLKFVEDTKESDGKAWKIVINRLLFGVFSMQALLALVVGLKSGSFVMIAFACLPIVPLILLKRFIVKTHDGTEIVSLKSKRGGTVQKFPLELLHRKPAKPHYHPNDKEKLDKWFTMTRNNPAYAQKAPQIERAYKAVIGSKPRKGLNA